ncbi:MAG: hypothetical protein GY790_01645 [Bacteroidetes bacterium]|nr:hypothetical protein [Bacteroidota bacterium]
MTTTLLSLDHLSKMYNIEQDWLFEKLLKKLNSGSHLILAADQGWGIREYTSELGFQLAEKNPDIRICYVDMKPAHSPAAFLELFAEALSYKFPDATSRITIDSKSMDTLKLPALIAKRNKIRVAVFLSNSHLFHRFRDPIPFLNTLRLKLRNQKNCVFCLYGNNNPPFREMVFCPGPLSGFGQLFELNHNPTKHRSSSIRKIFHDHKKNIGVTTSVQMSYMVDNHPFYLKLLAWHALIRTHNTCTTAIMEKAMNDLIRHYDYRFHKIAENLTPKQLGYLRALIEGNQKLYSKTTREKYQLGSSSNVARLKLSLEKKEIIYTGYMENEYADPIFKEWLRRNYFSRL